MSRATKEEREKSALGKAVDAVKAFLHLDAPPRRPTSPPLGAGVAEQARREIRDRRDTIDRAIERDGG